MAHGICVPCLAMMLATVVGATCCGENSKNKNGTSKSAKSRAAAVTSENEGRTADVSIPAKMYPDARSALADILLRTNPTVIGFGEFHQNTGTQEILSALERFRRELLPLLSGATSDLIVETWVPKGCGQIEKQVIADVEQVTDRPKETENETIQLINSARALGIAPHILQVECEQYESLFDTDGEMDYLAMLELVGTLLGDTAEKALAYRQSHPVSGRGRLLVYGGALHNDLMFDDVWAKCTFGPRLQKRVTKYVAIDLFVPEFVKENALVVNEPWYPVFLEKVSDEQVLLIEKARNSFIIVFKSGIKADL